MYFFTNAPQYADSFFFAENIKRYNTIFIFFINLAISYCVTVNFVL